MISKKVCYSLTFISILFISCLSREKLNKSKVDGLYIEVEEFINNKNYESAIIKLNLILEMDSTLLKAKYDLSYCLLQIGKADEALNGFNLLLESQYDRKYKLYQQIGFCNIIKENYEVAIKNFSDAITLDTLSYLNYSNRAYAKLHLPIPDSAGACSDYLVAQIRGDYFNSEWVNKYCK